MQCKSTNDFFKKIPVLMSHISVLLTGFKNAETNMSHNNIKEGFTLFFLKGRTFVFVTLLYKQ